MHSRGQDYEKEDIKAMQAQEARAMINWLDIAFVIFMSLVDLAMFVFILFELAMLSDRFEES